MSSQMSTIASSSVQASHVGQKTVIPDNSNKGLKVNFRANVINDGHAHILKLPTELLNQILKPLNSFDLESVARTFNRRLYYHSKPLLQPDQWWNNHAKKICRIFDAQNSVALKHGYSLAKSSFPAHLPVLQFYLHGYVDHTLPRYRNELDLAVADEKITFYSPPDLRSWMRLDGSFGWLADRRGPEWSRAEKRGRSHRPTREHFNYLVAESRRLGLTLPPGFETFVLSDKLLKRYSLGTYANFTLGSHFLRCPSMLDKGNGGYLLDLHRDGEGYSEHLYLDKQGGNCVLMIESSLHVHERTHGIDFLKNISLASKVSDKDAHEIFATMTALRQADFPELWPTKLRFERYLEWAQKLLGDGYVTHEELMKAMAERIEVALPINDDPPVAYIEGITFEEWLVNEHFKRRIDRIKEFPADEELREYVRHVFIRRDELEA